MDDLFSDRDEGSWTAALPPDVSRTPDTVYFAFKPGPHTGDELVAAGNHLRARHRLTGRVSPALLHMTICPIGQIPGLTEACITSACKIAGRVTAKPFEIVLDRVRTYANRQQKAPLVILGSGRVPAVELFRRCLIADLRRGGFIIPQRQPDLHVTLFYDRGKVAEEPIDPIRWAICDFTLVRSVYGEGRHVELGRWSLSSGDGPINQFSAAGPSGS